MLQVYLLRQNKQEYQQPEVIHSLTTLPEFSLSDPGFWGKIDQACTDEMIFLFFVKEQELINQMKYGNLDPIVVKHCTKQISALRDTLLMAGKEKKKLEETHGQV